MDFVAGARSVLLEVRTADFAPGFTERLRVAAFGGRAADARSIAAPYYLNDLGVRRFEDPKIFFSEHVELFELHSFFDTQQSAVLLTSAPVSELAPLFDALVLLAGDYQLVDDMVRLRFADISNSSDYTLLICSGVVLASRSSLECRTLFDSAIGSASNEIDVFMAKHRLAAAEIKRLGGVERGISTLDEADRDLDSSFVRGRMVAGDRSALLAVSANLRALALLNLGLDSEAADEAVRSRSLSTHQGLVRVDPGASARYASQESINVAQMKIAAGELSGALEVLRENVYFSESFCSDYLSEALTAYAYGLFLSGKSVEAMSVAGRAELMVLAEGSPRRLRAVREILAASLSESGAAEQASQIMLDLDRDPIGLRSSRSLTPSCSELHNE